MMISKILNVLIIICSSIGVFESYKRHGLIVFSYYTILSNSLAVITGLLYVIIGPTNVVLNMRYVTTCVLVITFLITFFVLVPTTDNKKVLLCGPNFFNHIVSPILSFVSYTFFEDKNSIVILPVILSMIYGSIMLDLNYTKKIDGPYPFFRIYNQSKIVTVIWMILFPIIIYIISYFIGILVPIRI